MQLSDSTLLSITSVQTRRLAAFLPVTLIRQIIEDDLPTPGVPKSVQAATLFSDISGFTAMSEELASDGPRGAEELNRVLLMTFTAMIRVIHEMGGAVSHFYGDAMSIYFPDDDGRAAARALACAQKMQQLMLTSFNRVETSRPPEKNPFFQLTIKIGVGYGNCQELVVGDPERSLEFVLTGTAVDEAAQAEKQAVSGQVIASRSVLEQAGFTAMADFEQFVPEQFQAPELRPVLDWSKLDKENQKRLAAVIPAFAHRAIVQRLVNSSRGTLAEHRPVTSMFVQFEFVGDEDDSSAIETAVMGQQLHHYYEWACKMVTRFGQENAKVNRVLTGDKGNQLHIIFGAPVAPDAPDQAVRCALALQREKPDFIAAQKIGLTVGKVFAGPVGSTSRQEYTVVGDVVNLSARLMQICEPGQLYCDSQTAERASRWITFEALEPVLLKGKQTAVTPHVPVAERTAATQLETYLNRWDRPMIGRQAEWSQLEVVLAEALNGQGSMAALIGPTGVGKSRLTASLAQYWLQEGGSGLLGLCYPHTTETPYGPWRGIWNQLFALTPGMSVEAQVMAVVEKTQALTPDSGDDVGLWRDVIGLPIPQAEGLSELTAEAKQARFFSLARRCLLAQSKVQPLLLIFESIHWADQASLALIDDLSELIIDSQLFMVFTFRPDYKIPLNSLERSFCLPIIVSDLSPQSAREMLNQLVGVIELPAEVEQHLGLRSRDGGDSPVNPLFLEEAVRMLEGVGVLQRNGRLRINESMIDQIHVPDTIHGLLLARLDRLPVAERDLLQVASVIGRQFAAEPLRVLTSENSQRLIIEMLGNLSEAEMTRLVNADPDWIYLFQHAMTHEVAYESLPYGRRQRLHSLVADWLIEKNEDNLQPLYSLLAYHYDRANDNKNGLEYAFKAANDARNIYANQEAIELYNQAEKHLQSLGVEKFWETAVALYRARSEVLIILGAMDEAFNDAEMILKISETQHDLQMMAVSYNLMAEVRYHQGLFEEVIPLASHVIDAPQGSGTIDQLALAYIWAGWASSSQQDYENALSYLFEAQTLCVECNNNLFLARVYEALSYVHYLQKRLEASLEALNSCVALSKEFSTPLNLGIALSNIGFVQFTLGRYEEAVTTFDEAVLIGRDSGRNLLSQSLANRAAALSRLGDFEKAIIDFEEAAELLSVMKYPIVQIELHLFWGFEYDIPQKYWENARVHFENADGLISEHPESYLEEKIRLCLGLAEIELNVGSLMEARKFLDEAYSLIEEKELYWWFPVALHQKGKLELAQNHKGNARQAFLKGLEEINAGRGMPDFRPLLILELGKLASGEEEKDYLLECLKEAEKRSRFSDKLICFEEAGKLLSLREEESLQKIGLEYLKLVETLNKKRPG